MIIPRFLNLFTRGTNGADRTATAEIFPWGQLRFGASNQPVVTPPLVYETNFAVLPAAALAVTSDLLTLTIGDSTEAITRATKGGVNVTVGTDTDENSAAIKAAASTCGLAYTTTNDYIANPGMDVLARFETQVAVPTITDVMASVGLLEDVTDVDPTGTANDGAVFLFDPIERVTTGLDSGAEANWILAWKVDGEDAFLDSGVPVTAGRDYALRIDIKYDMKPYFYINDVLVGTGATALSDATTLQSWAGVENGGAAARSLEVRFLRVGRWIA